MAVCPNGHENPKGQGFCGVCGTPIDAKAAVSEVAVVGDTATDPAPPVRKRAARQIRPDLGALVRLLAAANALWEVNTAMPEISERRRAQIWGTTFQRTQALAQAAYEALDKGRAKLLWELLVVPGTDTLSDQPEDAAPILGVLRGYLQGCVDELTREDVTRANAEAYGEAKLRAERG